MDLHSYDNVERRFRHTDSGELGRAIAAQLLGCPEAPPGGWYFDLSFFSGGIGVIDQLAISVPEPAYWTRENWAQVVNNIRGRSPEEAESDVAWASELIWLFTGEEDVIPMRSAAVGFANENRRPFQTECSTSSQIYVRQDSDVNDWVVIWGDSSVLNLLGYSQG
ncbi:MAG: hypothetical protein C0467_03290 [Planctomycetaceae bacterium]|nr:hypothetical protein [Planctomycetaceae bacterium]